MYNTISNILRKEIANAYRWTATSSNRDFVINSINSGGIYAYIDTFENKVIYVGRTDNLDRRLQEHWSDNEPNRMLRNYLHNYQTKVLYKKEDSQTKCAGMELYLYKRYQPVCNDRVPDATEEIAIPLPL